jgi:hypothetical protein
MRASIPRGGARAASRGISIFPPLRVDRKYRHEISCVDFAPTPRRQGRGGGPDWVGLHHFGFVVENETVTEQEIKKHGGEFFMQLPNYPGVDAEKKFKDINGVVFDVSEHGWG